VLTTESSGPASMLTVYVVSDATGETADRMVRSALVQFESAAVRLVRRSRVLTREMIRSLVQEARWTNSVIVHTLVSNELRGVMYAEARAHGVDSLDLLGPLLERLVIHLQCSPQEEPGLFQQLSETRSRQIDAVHFAFRHDDGQRVEELHRAEVVLVGVSRTMKTPITLYLAYQRWFAANVPLIPELPLPKTLLALPAQRVFCLNMRPEQLLHLRVKRAAIEAIPLEPYASPEQIEKEIQYAEQLRAEHRWQPIDVTGKTVEEAAREIITLLAEQSPSEHNG
jgi:[pyruvate, water dikinase]-phosphate phosphotransferase / [pyruvate, water dikinase] kinase